MNLEVIRRRAASLGKEVCRNCTQGQRVACGKLAMSLESVSATAVCIVEVCSVLTDGKCCFSIASDQLDVKLTAMWQQTYVRVSCSSTGKSFHIRRNFQVVLRPS
uniref:Uncharacterized protein n=1 Tax=Peronospora matthiolae TaxID=2874970 RepID=A0AAV1T383_9STRA